MARFGRTQPASVLIGPQRFGVGTYELLSENKYLVSTTGGIMTESEPALDTPARQLTQARAIDDE